MAPKQKHREPIINAAITLFRRHGYAGTGLNDIVDESGAPKGSLYHYFPDGKVSIAESAVETAGRRVVDTLTELSESNNNSGELLIAHAKLLAGWMEKSNFRDGCPMTTVLLELCPQERNVTMAARNAYTSQKDLITAKLVSDGHSVDRAERLALLSVSAIQGALVQTRIQRSRHPLTVVAEELAETLRLPA